MMEMLTHESPFYEYLDYVEVDELLDAIAGRKKITAQLPQVCMCVCECARVWLFYTWAWMFPTGLAQDKRWFLFAPPSQHP